MLLLNEPVDLDMINNNKKNEIFEKLIRNDLLILKTEDIGNTFLSQKLTLCKPNLKDICMGHLAKPQHMGFFF